MTATVSGVSPTSWDNRSSATFTLTGTNFVSGDTVKFHPCDVEPWTPLPDPSDGKLCHALANPGDHEVNVFTATLGTPSNGNTTAAVSPNLTMAPAGLYYLTVQHKANQLTDPTPDDPAPQLDTSGNPLAIVRIYDIGAASLRSISAGVDSSGTSCDPIGVAVNGVVKACSRPTQALDLMGSNFSIGADVQFLRATDLKPDSGIHFAPGNPGNGGNSVGTRADGTGYPSTTLIQGTYTRDTDPDLNIPGFTPGRHIVKVVNTYQAGRIKDSGSTAELWQPWFRQDGVSVGTPVGSAASPSNEIGAGAQGVTVTVKGRGFRPTTKMSIQGSSYSLAEGSCSDITIVKQEESALDPTKNGDNDSMIVATVNVASCTHVTGSGAPRFVSVGDISGASWTRLGEIRINPAPVVDNNKTFATLGQGAGERTFTVTGTGFAADSSTPGPTTCPSFDFGDGATAKTISCPTSQQATVTVDLTQDAKVGNHSVTVTNPADLGSSTTGPGTDSQQNTTSPLIVTSRPSIKTLSKQSFAPGTGATPASYPNVTITGSNFENDGTGKTALDLFDPTTFNPADSSTWTDYPGVIKDSVNVTKASTVPGGSPTVDTITFNLTVESSAPKGQPIMVLTNPKDHGRLICTCIGIDSLSVDPSTQANTGPVNVTITGTTLPGNLHLGTSLGAHSTLTLVRSVPAFGQGPIVGTPPVHVAGSDPYYADRATSTLDVTDAAPGAYNLIFVADSGSGSSSTWSCTGCFTVTAAGAMTLGSIDPTTGGQGATDHLVKVMGTNFTHGTNVTIEGEGITLRQTFVSNKEIDVLVDIATNTPTGGHTLTVTRADETPGLTTTFTVTPAPTPTTVNPAAMGAGAGTSESGVKRTITVSGQHFDPSAGTRLTVAGGGVTVSEPKVVKGSSPPVCVPPSSPCPATDDTLTVTIAIDPSAQSGARDITVINGDGGMGTLAGSFTIDPGPAVQSVAAEDGATAVRPGHTRSITVRGGGFVTNADPTKASQLSITNLDGTADSKLTLANVVVVSATKITADVSAAPDSTWAGRRVSVTNPNDFGFGRCDTCFSVAEVPGAAGTFSLVPGPRALTATWTAAAPNGSPVAGYKLELLPAGSTTPTVVLGVDGATRSYTFTGLVNGLSYAVSITAINGAGSGPRTTATGIAGLPSALSIRVSPTAVTYGSYYYVTGKLTSNGVGIGGKTLILTFVPTIGASYSRAVTTIASGTSTGVFSYRTSSPYTVRVKAQLVPNDPTYRPVGTSYVTETVRVRILKSAPVNGSRSSYTTTLKITGTVAPNKRGRYAYLYRYVGGRNVLLQRVTISSTSTFAFAIKPGKGTYLMHVYVPATPGNAANYSGWFTLYRV